MAGAAASYVEDCLKRYEAQGLVLLERLTPEQRANLERRGVLPKPKNPAQEQGIESRIKPSNLSDFVQPM